MRAGLKAKTRWLLENFRVELAVFVWVVLLYIWVDADRAIPLLHSPWGWLLVLFTVVFFMLVMAWWLLRLWRNVVGEVKCWCQAAQRLQQSAKHVLQKAREHRETQSRKSTE